MATCSPWTLLSTLNRGRHKSDRKTLTSSTPATSGSTLKRGRNESNTSLATNTSLNTSGRTFRRSEHGGDSETSLAASPTTEDKAPYHRLPFVLANPRPDLIYFREGHTLEKHLQAIGHTKENFNGQFQSFIVSRRMNKEELERVRRDSGVEKVVQVTEEMEELARSKDRTLAKQYGPFRPAPGYFVSFFRTPLSLKIHFIRIRQRFENVNDHEESGYFVKCPESKLQKIFSDPNVSLIEQNSYGISC